MVRGLLCIGGLGVAALVALIVFRSAELKDGHLAQLFSSAPTVDEAFQRGFRSDVIGQVNRSRLPLQVEAAGVDQDIQAFLGDFVGRHPDPETIELDEVFNSLQKQFPGAQYLAANLVTSGNREDLLSKLAGWTAVVSPDFDSVNTALFSHGRQLGALAVMSKRIPAFTLKGANNEGGRFFNECPHCGEVHALEVEKEARTLILSCPYCELPFDVLAVDTSGQLKRALDFFDGFQLVEPRESLAKMTGEERVLAIWQRISDRCEYQLDHEHSASRRREIWKHSRQTWEEKAGDCEDTSILLADALISAGFAARVAIGWNGNIGQHAWVVVEIEDQQYVLESTLQGDVTKKDLVVSSEAAAFYQPEQLFDRERLYYTVAEPKRFSADYFSPSLWKPLPLEREGVAPTLSLLR